MGLILEGGSLGDRPKSSNYCTAAKGELFYDYLVKSVRDSQVISNAIIANELKSLNYQLDFTTPGSNPWCAISRNTWRDSPKSL
jgi:hypothetical protein